MKPTIEKLESLLNQGLYGREEEIRLALLCALSNTSLLLYGHDDSEDIQARFEALFENTIIRGCLSDSNLPTDQQYTIYCHLKNHSGGNNLAGYLFTPKNTNILEQLRACIPDAKKVKTFLHNYDFSQLWTTENQNKAMTFIESLTTKLRPLASQTQNKNMQQQTVEIADRQLKEFLHLIATNLIISGRKEVTTADFGMFYYCVQNWGDNIQHLESIIHNDASNTELSTFVFCNANYENERQEKFLQQYENANTIPNLEHIFYIPYSSSPQKPQSEIFSKLENFAQQFQNISNNLSQGDLKEEMKQIRAKESALKTLQAQEMEFKETQLSQLQPKYAAFKATKESIEEKLKIANTKETEFREKREALENKLKDAKIREQQEGLKAQIADVLEKEEQFKSIKTNLETQIQEAKQTLETALAEAKKTIAIKQEEVREKEKELQTLQDQLKLKLDDSKGNAEAKLKEAKEYLAWLRSLTPTINKLIESCQKEIQTVSKPNPIWLNPLKMHAVGLEKIQKNLPNIIQAFDGQIKKYEENMKDKLQL